MNGGASAAIGIIVIVLILLLVGGCMYGPRAVAMHSCGASSRALHGSSSKGKATKYKKFAEKAKKHIMAKKHHSSNQNPELARHPLGDRNKVSMAKLAKITAARRGRTSREEEPYLHLRHPIAQLEPVAASIRVTTPMKNPGFGAGSPGPLISSAHF